MTLTLQLSDEQATALEAKAAAEGLSVEAWIVKLAEPTAPNPLIERPLQSAAQTIIDRMRDIPPESVATMPKQTEPATPDQRNDCPLQTAADIVLFHMGQVPPEMMAAMPTDGARQHDHYFYGSPKREV